MNFKEIKTEEYYNTALNRFERIFHCAKYTDEGDETESLSIIIEKYEELHYVIDNPDLFSNPRLVI